MKDFAGKIAFITGGACGAGLGYAQLFSEAGMKVVIADNREDHLEKAKAYFADKDVPVHFINMDVTDRDAYAAAADETEQVFGDVPNLLILNAGVNVFGPAEASTYDDFDWVTQVCYFGVVNGLVTFVPRMIKAGGDRHIAATVSWGAFNGGPITAPYSAAKAAALNVLEGYWQALKPYHIGVTAICPANIKTDIWDSCLKNRPEKWGETGYNVTEKSQAFLATIHTHGMEPRVLGQWLKEGIENDQFLVVPYKSGPRMAELAMSRFKYFASPEGMKEWEKKQTEPPTEEEIQMNNEREGYDTSEGYDDVAEKEPEVPPVSFEESGWAKARPDLDWVLPEKRFQG